MSDENKEENEYESTNVQGKRYAVEPFDGLNSVEAFDRLYLLCFMYIHNKIIVGNDKHLFRLSGFVFDYMGSPERILAPGGISLPENVKVLRICKKDGTDFQMEDFYTRQPDHKVHHYTKTGKRHVASVKKLINLFLSIYDSQLYSEEDAEKLLDMYSPLFDVAKYEFKDKKPPNRIVLYDGFIGDGKTKFISESGNFDSEICGFWRMSLRDTGERLPPKYIPMFAFLGLFTALKEGISNELETIVIDRSWISQNWFNKDAPDHVMNDQFYLTILFQFYAGLLHYETFAENNFKFPTIEIAYPERVTNIWPFKDERQLEREVYPTKEDYEKQSREFVDFFNAQLDKMVVKENTSLKRKREDIYMKHFLDD
jgi:hypothetical protein